MQDVSCTFYPVSPNNSTLYSSSTIHNQEIDINTIHGAYSEFTSVTCPHSCLHCVCAFLCNFNSCIDLFATNQNVHCSEMLPVLLGSGSLPRQNPEPVSVSHGSSQPQMESVRLGSKIPESPKTQEVPKRRNWICFMLVTF